MDIERRAGRIVGAIFIAQMAGSAVLNFRLEAPLFGLHTRNNGLGIPPTEAKRWPKAAWRSATHSVRTGLAPELNSPGVCWHCEDTRCVFFLP